MFSHSLDLLGEKHGYHFKDTPIVLHDQAFADDLSILTSTPKLNQETIDLVQRFLVWAFLKAKPPKCVCMGMKRFDPRNVHKVEYHRIVKLVTYRSTMN